MNYLELLILFLLPSMGALANNMKAEKISSESEVLTVSTLTTTNIAQLSATFNGEINSFNSATPPTEYGFTYSRTNSTPDLNDHVINLGTPTNISFFDTIADGLWYNTQYFVRAFALHTTDTVFGEVDSFTTLENTGPFFIDYNIRSDDFYAEVIELGIAGDADPVWQFRSRIDDNYVNSGWSSWQCLHDDPGSQPYRNGAWLYQSTVDQWQGTTLSNADNIYIGIQGWENEKTDPCTYVSGTDEGYSSDYDYMTDLNGSVNRNSWQNFKNAQQGDVDYVDCGTFGNDDYFKIEFDVWWNYTIPQSPEFSLTNTSANGFYISITDFKQYFVSNWTYEVSDNESFSSIISDSSMTNASKVAIANLTNGHTYYVRVKAANVVGTSVFSATKSITLLELNGSVEQNSGILSCQIDNANYQWLDCNDNYAPITGANEQTFTPEGNGAFAVEVSLDGITDTSDCVNVLATKWVSRIENDIHLYPNPTEGQLMIDLGAEFKIIEIKLYNATGQLCKNARFSNRSTLNFSIDGNVGFYFVKIRTDEIYNTYKIVKQ